MYTRGCCSFHFAFLARFATRPIEEAWAALVVLLCFMYHTRRRHVLNYTRKEPAMPHLPSCKPPLDRNVFTKLRGLLVVSDASWKTEATYAGVIIFFAGAAVDWCSVLLKVQCSSAEAEIAAGSIGSKRMIYIRNVLGEIFTLPQIAISHVVDNSATPPLTENLGVAKKSEHFRRWLHFMRYCVLHEMLANALTKVENKHAYLHFAKVFYNIRD